MSLRKTVFWLHLLTGITAGLVILVMSVTGVLLTYEKQMIARADRSVPTPPPSPGAPRLTIEELLAKLEQGAAAGATPSAITLRADPDAPASVSLGRRTVLVNPYTGQMLGDASPRLRAFFRSVTDWHRWLALSGDRRATGKAVTGACNLAFLFLVVSGFYLWWPRTWRWNAVKAVTLFGRGLRGKARDWNWHNVIGFWSAVPLAVVVASATIISYPWASDLVYRIMGEAPPARGPAPAAAATTRPATATLPPRAATAPTTTRTTTLTPRATLEAAFARAQQHAPDWRTITLPLPRTPDAPLTVTVDRGTGGQPQKRATLTIDRATAAVTKSETFDSQSPGRRLRTVLRFAHTGEVLGLAGQTIAGLASAGAAVLVYTGFALTYRRFRNRRGGGKAQDATPSRASTEALETAGAPG